MIKKITYKKLRQKLNRYNKLFNNRPTVSIPEIKTWPKNSQITNRERSLIQLYEFVIEKPTKYFAYVCEVDKQLITWTGNVLGTVRFVIEYKDSFGGTRVAITVKGINGIKYYGTYYKSSGDYARIKAYKN